MLITFITLTAITAFLFYAATGRKGLINIDWSALHTVLLSGICIVSLLSVLLLEAGHFNVFNLLVSLAALSLVLIVFIIARGGLPAVEIRLGLDSSKVLLVLILLFAAVLRFPPSNYVAGGQDQGVYVNVGHNIARTGQVFFSDPVLEELRTDKELSDFYKKNNYRKNRVVKNPGKYEGNYLPGIYIKDYKKGEFVPQFLHVQPLWFAITSTLLGQDKAVYPLFFFSLINILAVYLLSLSLFKNHSLSLVAALIIAANPLHTFMSRFPVTEVTASMFFLSALYLLVKSNLTDRRALILSVMCLGCFFFTRISGFILLPPLAIFLLYVRVLEKNPEKRANIVAFSIGVLLFYAYALWHAYVFSFPYTYDIFTKVVGRPKITLLLAGIATILVILTMSEISFRDHFRRIWFFLAKRKKGLAFLVILSIIATAAYLGFLLAFTDHFVDTWMNRTWKVLELRSKALHMVNIVVLAKILTPAGLLLFIWGLYRLMLRSFYHRNLFLLVLFTTYFFAIYNITKFATPYLYYYGRYMLSELIPLMVITLAYAAISLVCMVKGRTAKMVSAVILVVILVVPQLYFSYRIRLGTELEGFYEAVKAIDEEVGERSIVFYMAGTDKDTDRRVKSLVTTTMVMTFDIKTLIFPTRKFDRKIWERTAEHFAAKGYEVYLLTPAAFEKKRGDLDLLNLTAKGKLELVSEPVIPYKVMLRSLRKSSKGAWRVETWLPIKYRTKEIRLLLYKING